MRKKTAQALAEAMVRAAIEEANTSKYAYLAVTGFMVEVGGRRYYVSVMVQDDD